jgi:Chaperone of endosialidase
MVCPIPKSAIGMARNPVGGPVGLRARALIRTMRTLKSFNAPAWLALVFTLQAGVATLHAQNTAFTYQGQLRLGGVPATGIYDLQFALYDSTNSPGTLLAGPLTVPATGVTQGLFTVTIDFGAGVFNGSPRWLAIGVRTNGGGAFTTLAPRQELTPTPYALFAEAASNVVGTLSGSGAGLTNVNAAALSGLAATSFWQTSGNSGTSPAANNFLGTTDNQPLELRVSGQRALRLEPTASSQPNVVGGSAANAVASGAVGATIAGGDGHNIHPGANYAVLSGGQYNLIDTNSPDSAIVGGAFNSVLQNADHSFIGGGYFNIVIPYFGSYHTLCGGEWNAIGGASSLASTIGGGSYNQTQGSADTVAGGTTNISGGFASTVPGGANNSALGDHSLAAGNNAQATNNGTFVWADATGTAFTSSAANEFSVRATGGVRFVSAVDGAGHPTAGVSLAPGATSWGVLSDRRLKKDFAPVDGKAVLAKLATVPIEQWHYTWEASESPPNLGPMAQDFISAFYPGRDTTRITTLEFDGVELAAIQGLQQELRERDAEIGALKLKAAKVDALEQRLAEVEKLVRALSPGK